MHKGLFTGYERSSNFIGNHQPFELPRRLMVLQGMTGARYDRALFYGWPSVVVFSLEFILLDIDLSLLSSERPQSFWRQCQHAGCLPV